MTHLDDPLLAQLDGNYRRESLRVSRQIIWIVCLTIVVAIVWGSIAQVNEITRGDGTVIPMRRMQTMQSLEGGIVAELLAREGDIVQEGDVLARIDNTQFKAAFLETQSEIHTLQAEIARLEAEVLEQDRVDFGDVQDQEAALQEAALFAARRAKIDESISVLEQERDIIQRQIDITQPLTRSGSVSEFDLLKLQQQEVAIQGRISEIRNSYVQDAYRDLVEKKARLVGLQQVLLQRQDQLERTDIRARLSGRVNNVNVNTIGGVVQPGQSIMEITPIDDQLLIEAKVMPKDVAFIAPGMPASVKVTAYDYSIYGDLRGTVSQISEDTVEEETPRGPQDFYRVMVVTDKSYLERFGEKLPIRPGMVAQVDIESGTRSIMSYLTRPLLRARLQ